jgi:hypothetical protein
MCPPSNTPLPNACMPAHTHICMQAYLLKRVEKTTVKLTTMGRFVPSAVLCRGSFCAVDRSELGPFCALGRFELGPFCACVVL